MELFDYLRKVPLFAELPDDDLRHLCVVVKEVDLGAGEELFAQGSHGDRAYIIRDGQMEVIRTIEGRSVLLAVVKEGEVIGEMSLLESAPRNASLRARTDATLFAIDKEQFDQLLSISPSTTRALLNTVLARLRSAESLLSQSEKMAQLGTLTAGVAHELNNPAAAVKRGADHLQEALIELGRVELVVGGLGLSNSQHETLLQLVAEVQQRALRPPAMDPLARSDQEAELEDWLDEQGVKEPWDLAPSLSNLGYTPAELESMMEPFTAGQLEPVIACLGARYTVHNLLAELSQGAQRISEIIKALKSYVYLDQAPVQTINIHTGLDDTLLILHSKLKSGISVRREYAPDLPKIEALASELNQVWTNLIDNAADAVGGQGEITIRTRQEGDWVVVEVEDNGPGIPPEIQHRIFDLFYTTKPQGEGTGLGLHITYNIIVDKHRGDIKLTSEPGKTCFQIWLPIRFVQV